MKYLLCLAAMLAAACQPATKDAPGQTEQQLAPNQAYFDNTGRDDLLTGGVKLVPISTEKGQYNVWTKRVGNNPKAKVLLLHGGPGATHEYFECFDAYLPGAGIEYYYYDQLESGYSDQPNDSSLWHIDRYVEEVEQVRQALGLDAGNFFLLGHSWGGILTLEYALKYPQHLKGAIVSNMVPSIPDYIKYANEVLGPQLPPEVLQTVKALEAANDYANPKYIELVVAHYYPKFFLRMPIENWPEPVSRAMGRLNTALYNTMQGPSEFGIVGNARIKSWDRKADLPNIAVPLLAIGGTYDTMNPEQMAWMAKTVQRGTYLHCPQGSHMAMYDDQAVYFEGLVNFIKQVAGP